MEIKQVKGNTYCIDTGMTYLPFYKINDEDIIMCDSGWAEGEREGIDALLEKNHFRIVAIICSHAHIDHIGNNAYFKKKYNCIIAMSAHEALICSSPVSLKVYYSSQSLTSVAEHFGHMVCETDIMIADNQDQIYICGTKFKIIHASGHSPAHIGIITPDNVAYLGDMLISEEVMKSAKIPYAYILKEDLKSKFKLYDLKCSKYIISHKGVYHDIRQLITDNINFYKRIAAKVYGVIDEPMTMEDILKAVTKDFNIHIKSVQRYVFVERMLRSYVEYLHETGAIELNIDDGFIKYKKTASLESPRSDEEVAECQYDRV